MKPGPYIVTTTREEDSYADPRPQTRAISRVAVATLEKARRAAWDRLQVENGGPADWDAGEYLALEDDIDALTEDGGAITLPDGTVAEVERTTWWKLARIGGVDDEQVRRAIDGDTEAQQRILDAFNAQEAKR